MASQVKWSSRTVINKEEDIAAYTIKTVDDPKTVNKILYNKPPKNTLSMNEMVALWEKKVGKSLEKTHISEELVLKTQKHPRLIMSPVPMNVILSINHSVFVKGDQTNFTIEPSFGLEASVLYRDVMYTCIEEYLSHFA
ncbi:isoflavone reductase homolog P3-like [Brassica rapa]|uniref:isoflavone reductase homolog P3-like n=1 Tax=Brassica campestris TaxID=3711 RepID=UPI00142E4330|nr:isoflavone reductase homolog P3-like [Brassica rapa]